MTQYTNPGFSFAGQIGYGKEEIDQRLAQKANTAQVYSTLEVDERVNTLDANISTVSAQVATLSADVAALQSNVYTAERTAITGTTAVTNEYSFFDPAGSAYDVTLPTSPVLGERYVIKNIDAGAGTLTVTNFGSLVLNSTEFLIVVYDGTDWQQLN